MLVPQGSANGGGALVLRVTNVYGDEPRGKNFVSRVAANGAKSAADGESIELKLPSDQYATPVDAADIADVAVMLVADGKRGVYHVAAGEYLSRVQLAARVLATVPNHAATIKGVPTSELGQASCCCCCCSCHLGRTSANSPK